MKEYHVLCLGAGVQSTCLYLLSREPDAKFRFDVAIFADTQEEPSPVYRHLEWLQSLGSPPIWVRSAGKLGDDVINGISSANRFMSIPAFAAEDKQTHEAARLVRPCENQPPPKPSIGRLRRQCTRDYKIDVVNKAIRRELLGLKPYKHIPKDVQVYQYFGITTDERQRADKAKVRFETTRKWSKPVYPFLDMDWSRDDCIAYLKDKVPHVVPKSACVFCPYRNNTSWKELKATDPEGWVRAVEIDNALRDPNAPLASLPVVASHFKRTLYLHRSCVPLQLVDFDHAPTFFRPMNNECEGMCGV